MSSIRPLLYRWGAIFLVVFSFLGENSLALAQTPSPTLPPENNPLDTTNQAVPQEQALPSPAFSSGNITPDAVNTASIDDRDNTTPTFQYVLQHQTVSDVTNAISTGYRIVDLEVEQFSPSFLLTVTLVQDSGTYQKAWWWYLGVTEANVNNLLTTNNARLVVLKPYDSGGGAIRFAVVMISNTGGDSRAWYWFYNQTVTNVTDFYNTHNVRLYQVHAYITGGQTRYAVIFLDNSGANNLGWWWYVNATVSDVVNHLSTNQARLIDLDRDPTTGNLNVIMVTCPGGCPLWWWYVGVASDKIIPLLMQNGARAIDVITYPGCGGDCHLLLMVNNSNAITSRVGQLLRSETDGTVGLFLKQVNGPVLANLMDTTPFEPASALKIAAHLYTFQQVQNGFRSLTNNINQYQPPVGSSCPGNIIIGTESINAADRDMMWHSNNTSTRELTDTFGNGNINTMMTGIGMTSSSINHIFGCGGPIPNATTLSDLSKIYEGVANGTLLNSTNRDLFWGNMAGKAQFTAEGYDWTGLWTTDLPAMITAEAPAGMPQAFKDWFRSQMNLAYKAGNYKLCGLSGCAVSYVDDIAISGWAQIPYCDGGGPRQYTFGVFIYNATSDANSSNAFTSSRSELLREQIHNGLASCYTKMYLPGIIK